MPFGLIPPTAMIEPVTVAPCRLMPLIAVVLRQPVDDPVMPVVHCPAHAAGMPPAISRTAKELDVSRPSLRFCFDTIAPGTKRISQPKLHLWPQLSHSARGCQGP